MYFFEGTATNGTSIKFAVLLLLAACSGAPAEKAATPATTESTVALAVSSNGTDFYLTLPDHICSSEPAACMGSSVSNRLIIASTTATSGEVTYNGLTSSFTVNANSSTEISLDAGVVLTSNETVESKGIHVTSMAPVSVHVVSENTSSADGYLAFPTNGLGTNYRVMSYASNRYWGSEFAIVATQDDTMVTITPAAAGATQAAGKTYSIILNAGQTYQLQNPSNADMTGTLINADKPVAVFGGHRCADIPNGKGYCDYVVEQLPDTSIWGNTFQTTPFSERSRYTVRILAYLDGTTITSNPDGLVTTTLNAGQFADVILSAPAAFSSNNPVLVAQFINGFEDDAANKGDPSMVLVFPSDMGMTSATFGVYGLTGSTGSHLNVVTETSALTNLMLDGTAVDTTKFTPVNSSSLYSQASLPVSSGVHQLSGSAIFTAMIYDYGNAWNAVSYAYPVVTMLSLPVVTVSPNATTPNAQTTACEDEEDEHHHRHRVRHHRRHHYGEYCLLHHTAHHHDGYDHKYDCH